MLARAAVLSALVLGLALVAIALQGVSAVGSTLAAGEAASKLERVVDGRAIDCPRPPDTAPVQPS